MKTIGSYLSGATPLPIEESLDELKAALRTHDEAILQAPPGAGKTTVVPLALAGESWLGHKKILMLEPRRIATRAAAARMSELIGEAPGQTVGYRMRLDTQISHYTKIEVITEGILTRMLQEDPSLADVGLVIFDEFHERSLDADLAFALCLKGRALFREEDPLKVLVMSATLNTEGLSEVFAAPVIQSEGKQYPVEVVYGKPSVPRESIVDKVVHTILRGVDENPDSSILVFLPGQGEIRRVADALGDKNLTGVEVRPLFGNMSIEAQREAIATPTAGAPRKVVLATNIAETSLTIEGVDVVIDSGLVREPVFDPATGLTRLQTAKISQASSVQRAGRAGRLRPGKCYRLWSRQQQDQRANHTTPEILNADLVPVALQLLQWGIADPAELVWIDPPGGGAFQQAIDLLVGLGAVERDEAALRLTDHGQMMSDFAAHPRLAHLLIRGAEIGQGDTASLIASVLSDRDPLGADNPDMNDRLDILLGRTACPPRHRGWFHRTHQLAEQFVRQSSAVSHSASPDDLTSDQVTGYLIACAYPDRVARRRHSGGYQLANGRGAGIQGNSRLERSRWLAVAEVGGLARTRGDMIRSAAVLDEVLFDTVLADLVVELDVVEWDSRENRFLAEHRRQVGELVLKKSQIQSVSSAARQAALIKHIRASGASVLPWTPALRQWLARAELVRSLSADADWPVLSDAELLATLEVWLGPWLDPVTVPADFKKLDLKAILSAGLTWEQKQQLEIMAPERLTVPSGSSYAIDYCQSPPVLAVKLQEMFGCIDTPTVGYGRIPLLVHLLSPAGRPLQVTQDLAGFWQSSYHDVKKEMKGRYPKHPWPDNPLEAVATRWTKRKK